MTWWGWMILGAVMLGAELFAVDAQFYLVFLGVSAAGTNPALLSPVPSTHFPLFSSEKLSWADARQRR